MSGVAAAMARPTEFRYDRGLHWPAPDLWLDPELRKPLAFVSHGHSDHCRPHRRAVATPATAVFYRQRTRRRDVIELPFGQPHQFGQYELELFPAGHILGSAQAQVRGPDGQTVVYTGDFRLKHGPAVEPCEVRRCDVLVMECTYGQPHYRFPAVETVADELHDCVSRCLETGRTPLVLAYALGKGQEALALLTNAGFEVLVQEQIYTVAQHYERLGVPLGNYALLTAATAQDVRNKVILAPPHRRRSDPLIGRLKRVQSFFLSGWAADPAARYRFGADYLLPLSDHADYTDLLSYVEQAQPRVVYTVHGEGTFAGILRGQGIPAYHLPDNAYQPGLFDEPAASTTA